MSEEFYRQADDEERQRNKNGNNIEFTHPETRHLLLHKAVWSQETFEGHDLHFQRPGNQHRGWILGKISKNLLQAFSYSHCFGDLAFLCSDQGDFHHPMKGIGMRTVEACVQSVIKPLSNLKFIRVPWYEKMHKWQVPIFGSRQHFNFFFMFVSVFILAWQ